MKALAILSFLISMTVFLHHEDQKFFDNSLAEVVASNYVTYRSCARNYVFNHKNVQGEIQITTINNRLFIGDIELPNNYKFINNRIWHTYVENKICYIYGAMSSKEINATKKLLNNVFGVGFVSNGYLVAANGGNTIALPNHITQMAVPAGKRIIVSVSNIE